MPDYLLPCPCGQKLRITPAQAGVQVACSCGNKLSVPTLRGLRDLEIAPPQSAPKSKSTWSPAQGILFASGLVIAAIGLLLIANNARLYAQIDKRYTLDYTDDFVQLEQDRIDKLAPADVFDEWSKNVAEGLGEKEPPPWIAIQKLQATRLSFIKGGSIALALGALLSGVSLLLSRPEQK